MLEKLIHSIQPVFITITITTTPSLVQTKFL
jgi:hypothetical protein